MESTLVKKMALPNENVKLGLSEEEITYVLFREDLRDLQGDAFDGSEEEMKIFQGVFASNGEDSLSESESPVESKGTVRCPIVESFGDGYLCRYTIRCILPCSRPVSRENIGKEKLLVPTKITYEIEPDAANQTKEADLNSQDKNPNLHVPTALPLYQMETDTEYQACQREVVNEDSTIPVTTSQNKRAGPQFYEIKSEIIIQSDEMKLVPQGQISTVPPPPLPNRSISPSVKIQVTNQTCLRESASQGMRGIVHELSPTTPPPQADQRDEHGSILCSCTLNLSNIENPSLTDLCTHLRAHANRLLAECGYKLKLQRRRKNPEKFECLYQQPYGGSATSYLPKTWVSLGKMLQSSLTRSTLEKTHLLGRQWFNVNEFASDLLKTLTYVEKMLQDPDYGLTLSDQWFLLDPFVAVALIDRKIGALKKAVPVMAIQSIASVLAESEKMVLQRKDATNPLTYSRRRCKKSLMPLLALGTEQERKMDGANMLMVEGGEVTSTEGGMSGKKDIISAIVAEEEVLSASDVHKGPCTAGWDVHSATKLHAGPVTTGEKIPCTAGFHLTPAKCTETVPTTTGEEVQGAHLHASQVTNGEEALHTAGISMTLAKVGEGLHVNPVTIGEGSSKKHSCENPVTPPDNAHVGVFTQTFQSSTIQCSISSTLKEVPFTTVFPVGRYDNIQVGTTFTIKQVSESMVPQRPVLVLYPSGVPFPCDIIYSHSQSITNEVDPSIHQASLFQGTLSFDANSGLQIQEHPITLAMCKPLQSKSKRKRKSISETKENKPRKRLKKNKEKSESDTKDETHKRRRPGRKQACRFHEHDLLMSAIITKKSLQYSKYPKKAQKKKPVHSKHCTDQKVQLGETNTNNKKHYTLGVRTVLKLLINTGMVYVNCKIQFRNSKGDKVKEGKLTKDGVSCQCCGGTFTMPGFHIHSSNESGNPGLNLFLGSGKPYVMCLFKAWSVEYKGRREEMRIRDGDIDSNNDMCQLCGDGGELVCCDSCPSSFHELCMPSQKIAEDCWHCPSCRCGACEQMVGKSSIFSSTNNYLECSQCDRRFHEKCMKDKIVVCSKSLPGSWFCGNQCQQVYNYMRSQVGVANYIGDGFYFSMLRCDHGQTKILSLDKLVQLAENNMKLALALRITEECFYPILDPRTGLNLIPVVLYNWRVNILSLDCKGFYTVVLEKDEQIISVASIRLRGAMVAEMPLVATSPENREQGMCRRLVSAIEEMLKLLKVKMLVLCAMPSLVDTWTSHFGFVPIEDRDKEMLSKLSLLYIPGTYILKKDLSAHSVDPQGDDCYHASAGNEIYRAEGAKTSLMVE